MTFASTTESILYNNAVPVFADIEYDTMNIDPKSLRWSTGDTSLSISIKKAGEYFVEVDDGFCTYLDTLTILEKENCQCDTYIPNAVSLSSQNINNTFIVNSNCILIDFQMQVFDRWGGSIFQSNNPDIGWSYNNSPITIQTGIYSYTVTFRYNPDSELIVQSGLVTVF